MTKVEIEILRAKRDTYYHCVAIMDNNKKTSHYDLTSIFKLKALSIEKAIETSKEKP